MLGSDGAAGGAVPDASSPTNVPPSLGTQQEFCDGTGPPVLVDSTADGGPMATCPDDLAQRAFRYALCICDNYVSDHALFTDAFDGSQGAYDASTATAGGSVGVNGSLHPSGPMHVNGSLWASNMTTVTTSSVFVAGELHAQGEVRPTADPSIMADALYVQADAWLAGGLQTQGSVTIKGTLHVPKGQPILPGMPFTHGLTDDTPFTVQPACDCEADHLVDIAGVVATYEPTVNNDDVALNVPDPENLLYNIQTDFAMTLKCGRFFLTRIVANQARIELTIDGHVAIFVKGDISTGDFVVHVPPGSELDLFVGGNVTVGGAFLVGDMTNPARARTYVGGSTVLLEGGAFLAGNLYAPHATITLGASAPTTLLGAIFAEGINVSANLTIHYYEAILSPSSTRACSAP
jgi:hypothetical protein